MAEENRKIIEAKVKNIIVLQTSDGVPSQVETIIKNTIIQTRQTHLQIDW